MAFGINKFKSNLVGGGARPSLFEVSLTFPTFFGTDASSDAADFETEYQNAAFGTSDSVKVQSEFLIKGASIPASTVGTYDVFFHGKAIKVAGDRTFETWETTIVNDEGFEIRHKLEKWMELIQNHTINTRSTDISSSKKEGTNADYKQDITVKQYGKTGSLLRSYQFLGAFPSNLGAIALDWGTDGIEEFSCTWTYDNWKVSKDSLNRKIGV
jgi:hypothetical protein